MKTRAKPGQSLEFISKVMDKDVDDCIFWPFGCFADGYAAAQIDGNKWRVSRYICSQINGERSNEYDAAHSCGKGHKGCVNPKHLRWATRKENLADREKHGTINRGSKNGQTKLSEVQVVEIFNMKNSGIKQKDVAALFCIKRELVKSIWNGNNWSWLTNQKSKH